MASIGQLYAKSKVSRALVRQWEAVVHAGVTALDDTDELSLEMDEAKRAIETTLRPFVEAPTFSEFLLVHGRFGWHYAVPRGLQRRGHSLATARSRCTRLPRWQSRLRATPSDARAYTSRHS